MVPTDASTNYTTLGNAILQRHSAELETQLLIFQAALTSFAKRHEAQIKDNAQFKLQFVKLCQAIGVDPLSLTSAGLSVSKGSSKHDREEYHNNLAVRIIETCRATRDANGGLIAVKELIAHLTGGGFAAPTTKEVERVVADIRVLDGSFSLLTVRNKLYIKSVAEELNGDQQVVFQTCGLMGYVSPSILRDNYKWSTLRSKEVLDVMVRKGLLWVDEPGRGKEILYWEPSWIDTV